MHGIYISTQDFLSVDIPITKLVGHNFALYMDTCESYLKSI